MRYQRVNLIYTCLLLLFLWSQISTVWSVVFPLVCPYGDDGKSDLNASSTSNQCNCGSKNMHLITIACWYYFPTDPWKMWYCQNTLSLSCYNDGNPACTIDWIWCKWPVLCWKTHCLIFSASKDCWFTVLVNWTGYPDCLPLCHLLLKNLAWSRFFHSNVEV